MSFNLTHIWTHMGPLSKGIAFVLFMMAVSFIGVTIERLIAFSRSAKESRLFAVQAGKLLEEWKVEELIPLADKFKTSSLARLFGPIIRRYIHAFEDLGEGGLSPVQLARNEASRRQEAVGEELRRGMNVVATVGSISPFVGLLGTVVGIIGAFQGIGSAGSAGIGPVMAGISEALIETAFGLMVAIPAVIAFNYLNTKIGAIETALGRSAGELLDELENHLGRSANKRERHAA
ncbi:MAG TPA: MotA/TolQ/ExbB proton channel family protein [Polyangiaceae bacterium]|nr:MotA/TolQ/ExbB proton channel family protein [Polyangiaceae bacterium]